MDQFILKRNEINKSQFYQIILIDDSIYDDFSQKLSNNDIDCRLSVNVDSKSLYIVAAPKKLGSILKNYKEYELYFFPNDIFIAFLKCLLANKYLLENIEFLGENYFESSLSEELNSHFHEVDFEGLFNVINNNNLKINKFKIYHEETSFTFYRSGMIYSNETIECISKLVAFYLR
ncbi:MAG: hypothetical protein Q7J10_06970 [Methanosarcinaceae archaeon]|nr:hypothetical protein [Methanosarcinaceae archaeon]